VKVINDPLKKRAVVVKRKVRESKVGKKREVRLETRSQGKKGVVVRQRPGGGVCALDFGIR